MADETSIVVVGRGRLGSAVASALGVSAVAHDAPLPSADAYWLAVPDRAIATISGALPPGALVLHSAGSLGPEVLAGHRGAVLHPLMTFPHPPGTTVPATLDGHPEAVALGVALAARLGWTVVGGVDDRVRYHAACCLVSGHLAALVADAATLLAGATGVSESVARDTLAPLAAASLARVVAAGPVAITGPAARGDAATIAAHRAALPAELLPTYDALTVRIEKLRSR